MSQIFQLMYVRTYNRTIYILTMYKIVVMTVRFRTVPLSLELVFGGNKGKFSDLTLTAMHIAAFVL